MKRSLAAVVAAIAVAGCSTHAGVASPTPASPNVLACKHFSIQGEKIKALAAPTLADITQAVAWVQQDADLATDPALKHDFTSWIAAMNRAMRTGTAPGDVKAPIVADCAKFGVTIQQANSTTTGSPSAASLARSLKAAGLPITQLIVYTTKTDPNHLMGRQGEYTSKVAWVDPAAVRAGAGSPSSDRGGTEFGGGIEVFPTAASARARYIDLRGFQPPFGDGYDYLAGTAILRLSQYLQPAAAHRYERAFRQAATGIRVTHTRQRRETTSPSASASPAAGVTFTCKVESTGNGLVYVVDAGAAGAYNGPVEVSFYDYQSSGHVFPPAELSGTAPAGSASNWHPVPTADIGASAQPSGCTASAGG